MTNFEIYSLIISAFTAIGTCGATALALFFWFQGNRLKLGFHAMHANGYGATPNIEGGYLVLKFTNTGYSPINLELAGIKFNNKRFFPTEATTIICGHSNENLYNDAIPKILQHGESFIYVVSWNKFVLLYKEMESSKYINVFACISSESNEIKFKFDRYLKNKLKSCIKK